MTYSANHYMFPHYGIGVATAEKPLGPWTKYPENPIATTDPDIPVSGPGHNSIVRSPDGKELFIVYHAHVDPRKASGDRVVYIDRLFFDAEGRLKIRGPTSTPPADARRIGSDNPLTRSRPILRRISPATVTHFAKCVTVGWGHRAPVSARARTSYSSFARVLDRRAPCDRRKSQPRGSTCAFVALSVSRLFEDGDEYEDDDENARSER